MECAWKELLSFLPFWMREDVDRLGRNTLQELRLRNGYAAELVLNGRSQVLKRKMTEEDLYSCIHTASRYSPWAAATMAKGFLTAPGGHRIGICGEAVVKNGRMEGIRTPTSLCIRVARDISGIADGINGDGSLLIIGAPGWGKTTLLRDWIRNCCKKGEHVSVVDEREELFPKGWSYGCTADILSGCGKIAGIPMLLRTMGPDAIAVDEITEAADCDGILQAYGCGVKLYATAHASSLEDFKMRRVYKPLIENNVFHRVCVLHSDKSWHLERME